MMEVLIFRAWSSVKREDSTCKMYYKAIEQ